jgi:hypothetical protein
MERIGEKSQRDKSNHPCDYVRGVDPAYRLGVKFEESRNLTFITSPEVRN